MSARFAADPVHHDFSARRVQLLPVRIFLSRINSAALSSIPSIRTPLLHCVKANCQLPRYGAYPAVTSQAEQPAVTSPSPGPDARAGDPHDAGVWKGWSPKTVTTVSGPRR